MAEAPLKLKREVEPPQRAHSGLGIMLVASAAMFFAVAGSAFILRARMMHCDAVRSASFAPAPVVAPVAAPLPPAAPTPAPETDCGAPSVELDANGDVDSVVYEVCGQAEVKRIETPNGPAYATTIKDVQLR